MMTRSRAAMGLPLPRGARLAVLLMALVPAVVPEETAPSAAPTELPDNATAAPTLAPTLTPYPTPVSLAPTTWKDWFRNHRPTRSPTVSPAPSLLPSPLPTPMPSVLPSPAPTMAPVHTHAARNESDLRDIIANDHDVDIVEDIFLENTVITVDYGGQIGSTDGVKLSGNGTVQILVVTGTGGRVEEDRRRLEEDGELPYASAPTSELTLYNLELEGGYGEGRGWKRARHSQGSYLGRKGGAVLVRWPAALVVTDCTFTANAAPWNATAGLDHLHYSSGGAIYVDRTTALVYYSLFRENTAAGHGGAIALVGDGRDTSYLRVQSCKFNENEGRLASAIYVYHGDSYFKSNKVYEDRIPQTFIAHLVYGYCVLGWKCPDLGAIGGTIYFDERRGQCFCGVFFVTTFSFMSMIFAYLAGQTDPELVSVFGFARLQSTDALTYLVVGLSGYVVVAGVLADDGGVADDSLTGTKDYVAFEVGEVDDDAAGSAYDWVNACGDAGALAQGAIYPIVFVKFVACFVLYKRVDTEADSWVWKFVGIGVELYSTLQILGMLLNFSLNCLMELPTGEFYIPVDADDAAAVNVLDDAAAEAYAYAVDDPGESDPVNFNTPYTSFFCTMLSGLASMFVAYVHFRTPTWNSGLFERDW
ncbi:hypothetical protein JL720_4902 [Aureococcus anophagefferens]|nr:hypothetical protein JL720_4902 [Aureococcus anophagefferens]